MSNHNFEPDWPTRRKATGSCYWCGENLTPGVTYATFSQVHDGHISRMNMHNACFTLGFKKFHTHEEFCPHEMGRAKPEYQEQ